MSKGQWLVLGDCLATLVTIGLVILVVLLWMLEAR